MTTEPVTYRSRVRRTVVLGNVCVGKTSVFDALCLGNDHSVNIPGSTVQAVRGVMAVGPHGAPRAVRRRCSVCGVGKKHRTQCGLGESFALGACPGETLLKKAAMPSLVHLFDTPGSQTLAANGEDEMIARDLLLSGEVDSLLVVADAKNLRRSLAFFLEAAAFELPMVLDLNMMDEAETMGIEVDEAALAQELGVPVVPTVAVEREGLRKLSEAVVRPSLSTCKIALPQGIENAVSKIASLLPETCRSRRGVAMLLLSGDPAAVRRAREWAGEKAAAEIGAVTASLETIYRTPLKDLLQEIFHDEARKIVERVQVIREAGPSPLVRFGRLSQHPVAGLFIAAAVMTIAYYWIGVFGAQFIVDTLSTKVLDGVVLPAADQLFAAVSIPFVRDAFMDRNFGILPTGVFLALGIVLPVLFCFYLLQAVLEDSGYLPRLAVLLDRVFRKVGLNGQSLIPLLLGFSCVTMAVITTRMLPTKRERIILTLLLILGIPCAPLLAVMLVILQPMAITASFALFGTIALQIVIAGYLAGRLLPGGEPDLILEIPKMRIPRPRIILRKTWRRTFHFMKEALPIFIIASFAVFLFDRIGGLRAVEHAAHPFIRGVLGLPDEFVQVLIKTAIRRENGATELMHVREHFDNVQLVVTMLVMTFLMPCINATIVIFKERGIRVSLIILGLVSGWAVIVGAVFNFICRAAGVTFT